MKIRLRRTGQVRWSRSIALLGNKKRQVKYTYTLKINPLKRLSIKLIGYCYIVVIKKADAGKCRGDDNLPYVLNPLILLKLLHKFMSGVDIPNAKTPNLYKKWGSKIQPCQSPQGLPSALM